MINNTIMVRTLNSKFKNLPMPFVLIPLKNLIYFLLGTQYCNICNFRASVRGDVIIELQHIFDRAKLSIFNTYTRKEPVVCTSVSMIFNTSKILWYSTEVFKFDMYFPYYCQNKYKNKYHLNIVFEYRLSLQYQGDTEK